MPSSSDPDQRKKRSGRKRLPPVAPGPPLQFVTATHPDDFKADSTMRNVRSHVMYKHHAHENLSPSSRSTTPSRARAKSTTPSREKRRASTTPRTTPVPSQATQFVEPLDLYTYEWGRDGSQYIQMYGHGDGPSAADLQQNLMNSILGPCREFVLCTAGSSWMDSIFTSYLAFLSHACVASVYQDVLNRNLDDSAITAYTKSRVIREINERLQNPSTRIDDSTIMTIVHLIVSEIGSGTEEAFDVHLDGIIRIVEQRGGLQRLGLDGLCAFVLTAVVMNVAICRSRMPHPMFMQYMSTRSEPALRGIPPPESPIYCPNSQLFAQGRSPDCSDHTFSILCDMVDLTNLATMCTNSNNISPFQDDDIASYEASMQQIYTRLLLRPSASELSLETTNDMTYESCRLASLIYCRSLVHRVSIADSATAMHAHPHSPGHDTHPDTVLDALHRAVDHTNPTDCWRSMPGVFLWICLVGGAAAWSPSPHLQSLNHNPAAREWQRKSFALHATKAAVLVGFEYPNALLQAQRTMLKMQSLVARPMPSPESAYPPLEYEGAEGSGMGMYGGLYQAQGTWQPPAPGLVLQSQHEEVELGWPGEEHHGE